MKQLSRLASRFVNCPLMIHPPKLDVMVQVLGPRLGIAPLGDLKIAEPFGTAYLEAADDAAYRVIDGIAVIPIQGVLTKKDSWISALSGCSSYERIGGKRRRGAGHSVAGGFPRWRNHGLPGAVRRHLLAARPEADLRCRR